MKRILIALLVLLPYVIMAQSGTPFHVWTDFNPRYKLNDKWSVNGDVGYRINTDSRAQVFLLRPFVRITPNKYFSVDLGTAFFYSWDPDIVRSTEFRTFEYVFLNWPNVGKFKFKHRLGVDQRWFTFPELNSSKFIHRLRYRLGVRSPSFKVLLESPFYITSNVEWLGDINNDEIAALIDHNRFMVGLGNLLTEQLRAELQFRVIFVQNQQPDELVQEIQMLRVRVFYKIR